MFYPQLSKIEESDALTVFFLCLKIYSYFPKYNRRLTCRGVYWVCKTIKFASVYSTIIIDFLRPTEIVNIAFALARLLAIAMLMLSATIPL